MIDKLSFPQIVTELQEMVLRGQEMRDKNKKDNNYWDAEIDKNSSVRLAQIIKEIGFPTISKVGKEGMKNAWLIVQHSDHDVSFQESCLDLMKRAEVGEIEKKYVAYLDDRVRIEKKLPQLYGTQFKKVDGKWVPLPIEDESKIDERRAQMGMDTLKDQIKLMEEKG